MIKLNYKTLIAAGLTALISAIVVYQVKAHTKGILDDE